MKDKAVSNGLFTVRLDFGAVSDGDARYLQIGVRPGSSTGAFTVLSPRQAITAAPNALYASGSWGLTGNAGATSGADYLGTSDNQARVIKTNGAEAMRVTTV